jgi:hypothetical protein
MTPPRSPDWLSFIRSLPCLVCGSMRNVEAAHFPGLRGMAQKRSDFETGPLCRVHHQEQHRIGWPRFIQTYGLDIRAILEELREKPKLRIVHLRTPYGPLGPIYVALYKGCEFNLRFVSEGIRISIACMKQACGEYLRDQLMQRRAA